MQITIISGEVFWSFFWINFSSIHKDMNKVILESIIRKKNPLKAKIRKSKSFFF